MTHVDHAWRHRPKALGGTDPLEFTSMGAFTSYYDCVLADPTTVNFWPCNDASGDLIDIVGSDDMADVSFTHNGTWPQYGKVGPFAALPAQTAVENGGGDFTAVNASQSRFLGPPMPSGTSSFTLQGWIYLEDIDFGGSVVISPQIGMSVSSVTGAIAVSRGAVSLTGAVAAEHVWTHIRLDYNGTTLRLLQDFALVDSDAAGSVAAGGNMEFLNVPSGSINWGPFVGRAALWSLHDGVASTCTPTGVEGGSAAPSGYGPVADGSGGITWTNIATQAEFDAHVDDTTAAHAASAIAIVDAASDFTATDVEGALAELQTADEADEAALAAHLADTVDAHDASAVSIVDTGGYYTGSEVEAALQEIGADLAAVGGSAGRWEIVMEDGITFPPVPVTTEAGDDWLYALVED